jgi:hypothetical protein
MDKDGSKKAPQKPQQQDDSFLEGMRTEWKLFWHGIIGEEDSAGDLKESKDPFNQDRLKLMTLTQIKQITRAHSLDRKRLNQKIEQVQIEIESLTETMESQKLVGANSEQTIEKIKKLTDAGLLISQQLEKANEQIAKFRKRERELVNVNR